MKTMGRIAEVNGYKLKDDWYESFAMNSHEQEVAALHESWGTATKDRGIECNRCRGRGYTRKDQNVGCHVCLGKGVVDGES
jgi:uncharacterized paraquat-inducible protein A